MNIENRIRHKYKTSRYNLRNAYGTLVKMCNTIDGENLHMVELGCAYGYGTYEFYSTGKFSKIISVDKFFDSEREKEFGSIFKNSDVVKKFKTSSVAAAKHFKDKSLDLVYIDAGHEYEDVYADIKAWLPKVKDNGWIGGHDYSSYFPGVKKAVNELLGGYKYLDSYSNWLFKKKNVRGYAK